MSNLGFPTEVWFGKGVSFDDITLSNCRLSEKKLGWRERGKGEGSTAGTERELPDVTQWVPSRPADPADLKEEMKPRGRPASRLTLGQVTGGGHECPCEQTPVQRGTGTLRRIHRLSVTAGCDARPRRSPGSPEELAARPRRPVFTAPLPEGGCVYPWAA